jgi:hypothetical protein
VEFRTNHERTVWWYTALVELRQDATLVRDASVIQIVPTWSVQIPYGETIPYARIRETARSNIKDQIDKFINAYLTVNPRR